MTHRRLFLWLLLGTTLLLAGVWVYSTVRYFSIDVTPVRGGRRLACTLHPGTVVLSHGRYWSRSSHEPWSYNYSAHPEDLRRMRRIHGVMGRFRIATDGSPAGLPYYHVSFPVWLPWLLFNGAAFGLLRWQERRKKQVAPEI